MGGKHFSGNRVNERGHFTRFKRLHQAGMALANVERRHSIPSNGRSTTKAMQEVLHHLPDNLPSKQHWRDWLKVRWFRFTKEWEPVTVNKQIDSVTMPKWIAIGILGAILTFGVQSWWKASDQRDMLIRLETELRMSREFDAEKNRQLKEQAELNKVHIDNITGELKTIKGMLTTTQLATLEQIKRGNN